MNANPASHLALRCCRIPIKYGQRLENDFSCAAVHVLGILTVLWWNHVDLTTWWPGRGGLRHEGDHFPHITICTV